MEVSDFRTSTPSQILDLQLSLDDFAMFFYNFNANRDCDTIFYVRQPRTLRTSFICDVLHISEPVGCPAPRKRV